MATLFDGMKLKLFEILNDTHTDNHGHEISFEKTGPLEYTSVYIINCNRKYLIDLSSASITVKEIIVPDKDIIYNNMANPNSETIAIWFLSNQQLNLQYPFKNNIIKAKRNSIII